MDTAVSHRKPLPGDPPKIGLTTRCSIEHDIADQHDFFT
jgi:hypothetical protein